MFEKCGSPRCRTAFRQGDNGRFFVTDRADGLDARAIQVQIGPKQRVLYFYWLCAECCRVNNSADIEEPVAGEAAWQLAN